MDKIKCNVMQHIQDRFSANRTNPDFIILFNDRRFILGLITRWIRIGIKFHVRWNAVTRDEAWQRSNIAEYAHFVHLKQNLIGFASCDTSEIYRLCSQFEALPWKSQEQSFRPYSAWRGNLMRRPRKSHSFRTMTPFLRGYGRIYPS